MSEAAQSSGGSIDTKAKYKRAFLESAGAEGLMKGEAPAPKAPSPDGGGEFEVTRVTGVIGV